MLTVNGLDEEYTGWGVGEDADLAARFYNLGLQRKLVYGRATVFHLSHPPAPRHHLAASLARLGDTVANRKIRCERGLDQYPCGTR